MRCCSLMAPILPAFTAQVKCSLSPSGSVTLATSVTALFLGAPATTIVPAFATRLVRTGARLAKTSGSWLSPFGVGIVNVPEAVNGPH